MPKKDGGESKVPEGKSRSHQEEANTTPTTTQTEINFEYGEIFTSMQCDII